MSLLNYKIHRSCIFVKKTQTWKFLSLTCYKFYSSNVDAVDRVFNGGPLSLYRSYVKDGSLKFDEHQEFVVQQLQLLHQKVHNYEPVPQEEGGFLDKIFGKKKKENLDEAKKYSSSPNGLYIYGSVGTGKTMLMDMFYQTCTVSNKQRVHFHEFMLDVHAKIHQVKKVIPRETNIRKAVPYDPIPPVAKDIGQKAWLLCFDEFQVTDIADAMILKRLFSMLWRQGVIMVATSNRMPQDLYKNGLQRINFLPFIPMLEKNCDVLGIGSYLDYRRVKQPAAGKRYFVKSECNAKFEMDRVYEDLVSRQRGVEGPRHITVLGRTVTFPKTCGEIADCTFNELCSQPLGAVDYISMCKEFGIVLIRDIPMLNLEKRSEARRFITLIDTFYDQKMRLICSADAYPDELISTRTSLTDDQAHYARVLMGDLNIKQGDPDAKASLFTGEEELFAFERLVSRLTEMLSEEYWNEIDHIKRKT